MFKKQRVAVAVLAVIASYGLSAETLETIEVKGKIPLAKGNLGAEYKANEFEVEEKILKQRGVTLGEALSGELGIHSSQYGGGASSPVVRGQDLKRIKILQNNSENLDMSSMSPDHAIMADSILAKKIEVLRGPTMLLYSSGNAGGVINVVDQKIPTTMPEKGYEGQAGVRYSTANKERLGYLGTTVGLGQNVALRLQGLTNKSAEYRTRTFYADNHSHKRVPNSDAQSYSGTAGLSWIGQYGYLGVSYNQRRDKYGLTGHSHIYAPFSVNILVRSALINRSYLRAYPFLAEERDIDYDSPGLSLRHHNHSHDGGHSHSGHEHEAHEHGRPWIDLLSKRYDLEGELQNPFPGVEKIRLTWSKVNYRHEEKEGHIAENFFKNDGQNVRVELVHSAWKGLRGAFGIQYLTQKSSALSPIEDESLVQKQQLLNSPKTKNISLFALESLDLGKFSFEAGFRAERQTVSMDYDMPWLLDQQECKYCVGGIKWKMPELSPHKETAYSYALAGNWKVTPNHKLTVSFAHQERVPNAQELYAHGKHIATNSFEAGNKNLTKENSNTIELSLAYVGDKWDYRVNLFHTHFRNFIYSHTLNETGTRAVNDYYSMKVNRYSQSEARFSGVEGEIGYAFNPSYRVAVFGDYIRGKLLNLPDKPIGRDFRGTILGWTPQPDVSAARMPPVRLGMRLNAEFDRHWSGSLEYIRVLSQAKIAKYERKTAGYNLLNIGVNYNRYFGDREYQIFLKVDNLLNQKAYNHASYLQQVPLMGRNLMLGVNVNF